MRQTSFLRLVSVNFVFGFAVLMLACGSLVVAQATERATPVTANRQVYLDTRKYEDPAQTRLLDVASGRGRPDHSVVWDLIRSYSASNAYSTIINRYEQELFRILGVKPETSEAWKRANPDLYRGIHNYVGDSSDGERDEGPSWKTINRALRKGTPLQPNEEVFLNQILHSIAQLPKVRGLSFRGMKMTVEEFLKLNEGKVELQKAFTSTSLDFSIARGFGRAVSPDVTTVLIMNIKEGVPVSPLTFDYGSDGQPGRVYEREILLAPGANLKLHYKVYDFVNEIFYLFVEQV